MTACRIAPVLALLFGLFAEAAHAYFGVPYITPALPIVGDTVAVNIYQGGHCDFIDNGSYPGYPQVSQQGNAITILFTGTHEGDPEFCIYGIGTTTYPVDSYPAGSYTLEVDRRYLSFSAIWIQETLGIIPFTVSGVPTQPIETPTLSSAGFASLFLVLIIAERLAFLSHRV